MKNKSFVLRVLFNYLAVIGCFLAFMFFVFFNLVKQDALASEEASLAQFSRLMEERILLFTEDNARQAIRSYVADKALMLGVRVTFVAPDGNVIADSEEDPAFMDNHSDRPEIREALEGRDNSLLRFSKTLQSNMLYYAHRVHRDDRIIGVLRLSKLTTVVDAMIDGLKIKYLLIILFLVSASVAAILVIYRNFKKEIARFAGISQRVSDGDYDIVFPNDESYEINELGRSFRLMVSKIKTLIGELVFEKEETGSIIASVEEGIVVIDANGKIVRANESFKKLFNIESPMNRHYWEVIRENDIIGKIKAGNALKNSVVEFGLHGKAILCSIDYLAARSEHVLIFNDLSDLRAVETIKRDLVTNVSHELRTPLTSIMGYVETLIEDETDTNKIKYLEIVLRSAERLNNIIKDLLVISEVEGKKTNVLLDRVAIEDVFSRIRPLFEGKMKQKGLGLTIVAPDSPCIIAGDSFRLEQLFINLLDNAVKYTDAGGIYVGISNDRDTVRIEIKDSGIGIPENDLPRIFERFYVVDKSRSRAHGGTGLGLSIVKHIVSMHSGDISVTSRPGHGTSFIITFPALILKN